MMYNFLLLMLVHTALNAPVDDQRIYFPGETYDEDVHSRSYGGGSPQLSQLMQEQANDHFHSPGEARTPAAHHTHHHSSYSSPHRHSQGGSFGGSYGGSYGSSYGSSRSSSYGDLSPSPHHEGIPSQQSEGQLEQVMFSPPQSHSSEEYSYQYIHPNHGEKSLGQSSHYGALPMKSQESEGELEQVSLQDPPHKFNNGMVKSQKKKAERQHEESIHHNPLHKVQLTQDAFPPKSQVEGMSYNIPMVTSLEASPSQSAATEGEDEQVFQGSLEDDHSKISAQEPEQSNHSGTLEINLQEKQISKTQTSSYIKHSAKEPTEIKADAILDDTPVGDAGGSSPSDPIYLSGQIGREESQAESLKKVIPEEEMHTPQKSNQQLTIDPTDLDYLYEQYKNGEFKPGSPGYDIHPNIQKAFDNIMKDFEETPKRQEVSQMPHHHKTVHRVTHITHTTKHTPGSETDRTAPTKVIKIKKTHTYRPVITHDIPNARGDNIILSQLMEELQQLERSPGHRNVTWCEEKIKEFLRALRQKQMSGMVINQNVTEETLHQILTHDETIHKTVHTSVEGVYEQPFIKKTAKELGQNEATKAPSFWHESESHFNRTHTIQNSNQQTEHNPDNAVDILPGYNGRDQFRVPLPLPPPTDGVDLELTNGGTLQETGQTTSYQSNLQRQMMEAYQDQHMFSTQAPDVYTGIPSQHHIPALQSMSQEKIDEELVNVQPAESERVNPEPPPFVGGNEIHNSFPDLDLELPPLPEEIQDFHQFGHKSSQETEEFQNNIKQESRPFKPGNNQEEDNHTISSKVVISELEAVENDMTNNNHEERKEPDLVPIKQEPLSESSLEIHSNSHEESLAHEVNQHDFTTENYVLWKSVTAERPQDGSEELPSIEEILHKESLNQSTHESSLGTVGKSTPKTNTNKSIEYGTGLGKKTNSEEVVIHQLDEQRQFPDQHSEIRNELVDDILNGDQKVVSQGVDSMEGMKGIDVQGSSSHHKMGTYQHGQDQPETNGYNSQVTDEQIEQIVDNEHHHTVHDLNHQQINYETIIDELVQLESLPGHEAIDKCEEKIREFLEILRIQQERGFGQNQRELERLHKTLIQQAQTHAQQLAEQQPTAGLPTSRTGTTSSFWRRVGKKIKKTYEKAKEKAQDAMLNVG